MADSLIDIGNIVQLGQLAETRRRNSLFDERTQVQDDQNRIDQEQNQLAAQHRKGSALFKMAEDESYRADPATRRVLLTGAAVAFGMPEDATKLGLERGEASMRELLAGLRDKDPDMARIAFDKLHLSQGAEHSSKFIASLKGFTDLQASAEKMELFKEANREKVTALHDKQAKVMAGLEPYGQGVRDVTATLRGTDDPNFLKVVKVLEMTPRKPGERRTLSPEMAKLYPDAARLSGAQAAQTVELRSTQARELAELVAENEHTLALVKQGEPLPKGTTERDLLERIDVGRTLSDAYGTMAAWAGDPYNPTKLKEAKAAQSTIVQKRRDLENLKSQHSREMTEFQRESMTFRETEAGRKAAHEQAIGKAQVDVLEQHGRTPSEKDLAAVARKHGVQPQEILPGLADPAKHGKLDIGIRLGQEDVSRNLKMIESAQGVIDYTKDLRDLIHANPAIVGKTAQFGTAIAGAGQQLRAIAKLDPQGAKFLNTKTRDSAESLYEILVYMQARSMDPTGVLDVKVVQHARTVLGDFSSLTSGPSQLLNKLDVVTGNAERNVRRARRLLKGGAETALTDESPTAKPVGEMTEEELLRAILQGAGQ